MQRWCLNWRARHFKLKFNSNDKRALRSIEMRASFKFDKLVEHGMYKTLKNIITMGVRVWVRFEMIAFD